MEDIKRIDRKLIHKGHVIDLYEDTMLLPNGDTSKWDILLHKGAAAVVPVRDDGKILLVRQYRGPVDRITLEIPAGKRDSENESTYDCITRELTEETGYRSDNIELLLRFNSAAAYSSEEIDIYVATNLIPDKQHLDEDEFLDVEAFELEDLKKMILEGKIRDSKTIAAIMSYAVKYGK